MTTNLLLAQTELVVRTSFVVEHGDVRPLGVAIPSGRERQRSRIRERILATGKTSRDSLDAARRILRARIAARTPRLPR